MKTKMKVINIISYISGSGIQLTFEHFSNKPLTYKGAARILKVAGIEEASVERVEYLVNAR